jgi:hypothetical protein
MNHPVGQAELVAGYLKIQGDPTSWGLAAAAPEGGWADTPVAIQIVTPVAGTLILSPARTGSFALTLAIYGNGWEHGGPIEVVSPNLYIPTTSGLTADSNGYPLPPEYDLAALQQSILDAMTTGSMLPVVVEADGIGVVVLNGAQLPFAVLADVQTD